MKRGTCIFKDEDGDRLALSILLMPAVVVFAPGDRPGLGYCRGTEIRGFMRVRRCEERLGEDEKSSAGSFNAPSRLVAVILVLVDVVDVVVVDV